MDENEFNSGWNSYWVQGISIQPFGLDWYTGVQAAFITSKIMDRECLSEAHWFHCIWEAEMVAFLAAVLIFIYACVGGY
jgi:hypothetical protein